jgi:hypothetical protein
MLIKRGNAEIKTVIVSKDDVDLDDDKTREAMKKVTAEAKEAARKVTGEETNES